MLIYALKSKNALTADYRKEVAFETQI